LAKWSVSSRYCLSPQGEFIGCSSHEPRIAETARKLDCRQISTAVSGTAVSGIAAKEVSNGRPVRTTQSIYRRIMDGAGRPLQRQGARESLLSPDGGKMLRSVFRLNYQAEGHRSGRGRVPEPGRLFRS